MRICIKRWGEYTYRVSTRTWCCCEKRNLKWREGLMKEKKLEYGRI